jgi:hypothetical protein
MPRMKPPKGYYTLKEAEGKLNISGSMIRKHVEKGKIHYLLPEGRKHGFYLKSDVDKLANELEISFDLEEEVKTIKFTVATEADIPACIALNRELFTVSNSASDEALTEKWTKWMQKNPEIVHVLKRGKEVVGITTVLPTKPGSKNFDEALMGDISFLLGDVAVSTEDIEEYKAGNHIQLYVAEIGIKPSLARSLKSKYGARLISKFMEMIINLGKRGVILDNILAVGATRSGVKLLQYFGFSEVIFPRPDTRLFTINIKESGAPLIDAYREALAEYYKARQEESKHIL